MPKTVFGGAHQVLVAILVEAREASRLTQTELAKRVGKDQSYISLIERGQRRVDVVEFIALAEALGLDPNKLFRRITEGVSRDNGA